MSLLGSKAGLQAMFGVYVHLLNAEFWVCAVQG